MAVDLNTGIVTDKNNEPIADIVDGKCVMRDRSATPGWMKAQIKRAMNAVAPEVKEEKEEKKVVATPKKPSDFKVISKNAHSGSLQSRDVLPNTRWIYAEEETGFELEGDDKVALAVQLGNHRRYKGFPLSSQQRKQCIQDILTYTAKRCDKAFLI